MDNPLNKEIKIEIEEIISLANGDPQSILPGLFASRSSREEQNRKDTSPELSQESSSSSSESAPSPEPSDPLLPLRKKIRLNNYVHNPKSKYRGMQAQKLRFLLSQNLIGFCQEHNVIARQVVCHCGKQMKLQNYQTRGYLWSCNYHKNDRSKQTVRKGTFFSNSRLGMSEILFIAYMWVHEYSQISMMHEAKVAPDTMTHWIKRCQEVCQAALEYKNEPLGGEDRSVEIYECKFKDAKDDKWAFCALEQHSTKSILIIVHDKSSRSIVEIFDKYFVPGTVVVTHIWCAMKNLTAKDFEYLTEEKLLTFYDQGTKSEMKEYDDFKKVTRRLPPGANKWNKMEYGPFFFERMYRKSLAYAPDAYLAYLKDISIVYPPCTVYEKSKSED